MVSESHQVSVSVQSSEFRVQSSKSNNGDAMNRVRTAAKSVRVQG